MLSGITTKQIEFTGEPGERPNMIRRNTWTKLEGDMEIETTNKSEFKKFDTTRTTIIRRHTDNLTVGEGTIQVPRTDKQKTLFVF